LAEAPSSAFGQTPLLNIASRRRRICLSEKAKFGYTEGWFIRAWPNEQSARRSRRTKRLGAKSLKMLAARPSTISPSCKIKDLRRAGRNQRFRLGFVSLRFRFA
jgi:hypothetical protein